MHSSNIKSLIKSDRNAQFSGSVRNYYALKLNLTNFYNMNYQLIRQSLVQLLQSNIKIFFRLKIFKLHIKSSIKSNKNAQFAGSVRNQVENKTKKIKRSRQFTCPIKYWHANWEKFPSSQSLWFLSSQHCQQNHFAKFQASFVPIRIVSFSSNSR